MRNEYIIYFPQTFGWLWLINSKVHQSLYTNTNSQHTYATDTQQLWGNFYSFPDCFIFKEQRIDDLFCFLKSYIPIWVFIADTLNCIHISSNFYVIYSFFVLMIPQHWPRLALPLWLFSQTYWLLLSTTW